MVWLSYYNKLDKVHKYTLGQKIDSLFIEIIESITIATFLDKTEKLPWIKLAIRKTDTVKVLLLVLWEAKSINHTAYAQISLPLDEIGKMLGGWNGQINKAIKKPTS